MILQENWRSVECNELSEEEFNDIIDELYELKIITFYPLVFGEWINFGGLMNLELFIKTSLSIIDIEYSKTKSFSPKMEYHLACIKCCYRSKFNAYIGEFSNID